METQGKISKFGRFASSQRYRVPPDFCRNLEAVAEAAKGLATGFTDIPATHWASGYVGAAAKLGVVNGVGNNKFDPEAPVKYEDAITMIVRALGYEPAAKEKGAYPFGYLLASSRGLTSPLTKVPGTTRILSKTC